jgi:hypothetical protein
MDPIFEELLNVIHEQQRLISSIAAKINKLEWNHGGGGGFFALGDAIATPPSTTAFAAMSTVSGSVEAIPVIKPGIAEEIFDEEEGN